MGNSRAGGWEASDSVSVAVNAFGSSNKIDRIPLGFFTVVGLVARDQPRGMTLVRASTVS